MMLFLRITILQCVYFLDNEKKNLFKVIYLRVRYLIWNRLNRISIG